MTLAVPPALEPYVNGAHPEARRALGPYPALALTGRGSEAPAVPDALNKLRT